MPIIASSSKLRLGLRSNASMFEDMGNPWDRERTKAPYVPQEQSETAKRTDKILTDAGKPGCRFPAEIREMYRVESNPEFDQLFCKRAPERFETPSEPVKVTINDIRRKTAAILAQARTQRLSRKINEIKESDVTPGRPMKLQLASLARTGGNNGTVYSVYIKYEDGKEEELDRRGLPKAEKSFYRHRDRKDTVCVELWSYETGEVLLKYDRKPD